MTQTPSMDDKQIPSPPVRTTEQYEKDKAAGINRVPEKPPVDGRTVTQ